MAISGNKLVGKVVEVTDSESMYCGWYGVVTMFDGVYYHIAPGWDELESAIASCGSFPIFKRSEIRLPKDPNMLRGR